MLEAAHERARRWTILTTGTLRCTPTPWSRPCRDVSAAPVIEDVAAFKCIPYGAPTFWRQPLHAAAQTHALGGVRDALDYTGHAPQQGLRPATRAELADFSGPPDTSPETEDCLTLNVWSPGPTAGAKRPVMVWFHGGAFAYGTANAPGCRARRLAKRGDVVVVTVNQRLNIFGYPRPLRNRRHRLRAVGQRRHARHGRRA